MANVFRYVFDSDLYNGYWQPMPAENGREVYRISYPEHSERFGVFFEVVETGDRQSPYLAKMPNEYDQFHIMILKWFSDYKLLSG